MSKKIDEHRILELFFQDPREHHLREIARICHITPTTASKYLAQYVKKGLLAEQELRGNVLYRPTEHERFLLEKKQWNIKRIVESGLLEELNNKLAYPAVILFGSLAKAENHPDSDIDLFIISEEKRQPDLSVFEKKLKAPIQTFIHTKKEFKELKKSNPELLNNVINGYILSGFLEAF